MDETRRQWLRQIMGFAAGAGMSGLTGCTGGGGRKSAQKGGACVANPSNQFYVICHGMMLFEFQRATSSNPNGGLIVHIPLVPPGKKPDGIDDDGHIYKAGSQNNEAGLIDLAKAGTTSVSETSVYKLAVPGAAAGSQIIQHLDKSNNVVLDATCGASPSGDQKPVVQVTMPLPAGYLGWRSTYVRERFIFQSSKLPRQALPGTFFQTHILVYPASTPQPTLSDSSGVQRWPPAGQTGQKLHIVAAPGQPGGMQGDHSSYLNGLFSPTLDIVIPKQEVCTHEGPLDGELGVFCRPELIELNEDSPVPSGDSDSCAGGLKNVTPVHPTNCKTYFYIG